MGALLHRQAEPIMDKQLSFVTNASEFKFPVMIL